MAGFNTKLYEQVATGHNTMSTRAYNVAISGFTAMNILVATLGSSFTYDLVFEKTWVFLVFLLACMGISIGGAVVAHSHDDATTSVIGGFICAAAMGAMVGPFVALYEAGSVVQALLLSAGIVLATGLIGAVIPNNLAAWGAPLFACLLGLVVIQLVLPLVAYLTGMDITFTMTLIDYAAILLFSFIMVYDLNKAQRLDKTWNNAIDVAVNVFLNFANIFIRVLSLMGQKK